MHFSTCPRRMAGFFLSYSKTKFHDGCLIASSTVAAVFIQNCTDQGVCEHLVKSVTELANNPKRGKDLVALGIIPPLLSCMTRTFNSHTTSQSLLVAIHELLSKLGPKGLKSIS